MPRVDFIASRVRVWRIVKKRPKQNDIKSLLYAPSLSLPCDVHEGTCKGETRPMLVGLAPKSLRAAPLPKFARHFVRRNHAGFWLVLVSRGMMVFVSTHIVGLVYTEQLKDSTYLSVVVVTLPLDHLCWNIRPFPNNPHIQS